jgi:hypothetical protein
VSFPAKRGNALPEQQSFMLDDVPSSTSERNAISFPHPNSVAVLLKKTQSVNVG